MGFVFRLGIQFMHSSLKLAFSLLDMRGVNVL